MKKYILLCAVVLLATASYIVAQPAGNDLINAGRMSSLQASLLGRENTSAWRYLLNTIGLANNSYLVARNAAGTANIDVLKVDGSDNLVMRTAGTGNTFSVLVNGDADRALGFNGSNLSVTRNSGSVSALQAINTGGAAVQLAAVTTTSGALGTTTNHPMSYSVNNLTRWTNETNGDWSNNTTNGGNVVLGKSGTTISLQEATAATACMGVATPNGATPVAVTTSCATSGARVFYTRAGATTNMGPISTTTAPSGTGFSFGGVAGDTLASSVVWMIVKEAA